ncbi:2-phospho-L-lactate guanylyltransferase [Halobacteria archaeon AArc-curdl1]|uniref:2-phospho-L-lactate guanylyltransferase n=1 Tax=Natronosalvus hydrolyticus TaxID=2979988 RepID=A0AAP3E8G4_9EURY|nr:2-phospho-L-lactate guanylyltransferase [Halobacteria archaeon AArc-curdl1]
MQVVVPFAGRTPKSRLEAVLSLEERRDFARAMLADVCGAVVATGNSPTVLATAPLSETTVTSLEAGTGGEYRVEIDDRPLSPAVNALLEAADEPVAIVMADLALATPVTLEGLFEINGDVVIAPGRGGGTNAMVVRHPSFRVDYHGASYLDHRQGARGVGATLETVDSFRLATDIDEPADMVEVWLHSDSRSKATLEAQGFHLETTEGRVRLARD